MPNHPDVMEKLVSLAKRRGFIFQSSEIYGGTGSGSGYGPPGSRILRSAGGLPQLQEAISSRRSSYQRHAGNARCAVSRVWNERDVERGAPVQSDVQDLHGSSRG